MQGNLRGRYEAGDIVASRVRIRKAEDQETFYCFHLLLLPLLFSFWILNYVNILPIRMKKNSGKRTTFTSMETTEGLGRLTGFVFREEGWGRGMG